jgi:hypothetical protein
VASALVLWEIMDPLNPSMVEQLDEALLGRAVLALELAGEVRGLCLLMGWWSARAKPGQDSRLAHARALIGIRQVDRAWHILRELESEFPKQVEVKLLTARMFMERGWGARARRVLDDLSALPKDDPRLRLLLEQLEKPASEIPKQAREIARTGTSKDRLTLAEQYLLSGNQLRARTILERLKQEGSEGHRVEQLLAGIDGESAAPDLSQSEVLEQLLGWSSVVEDAQEITDIEIATEMSEHDPDTAEASTIGHSRGEEGRPVFPELFRSARGALSLDVATDDHTQASVLANLDELPDPPTEEASVGGGVDTQIMEIISSEAGIQIRPVDMDIHEAKNIKHLTAAEEEDSDEEDDDEVVIMTQREAPDTEVVEQHARRSPIEVFEKIPVPPRGGLQSRIETIELPALESELEEPTIKVAIFEEDSTDRYLRHRRGRRLVGWLIPLLVLAAAVGIWVWLQQQESANQVQLAQSSRESIVDGDYEEMARLAALFLQEVEKEKEPVAPRAVELALLELFLVAEYVGVPEGGGRAQGAAKIAEDYGASAEDLALIEAISSWVDGDLNSAQRQREGAGDGALQSHLEQRLRLETSQSAADYPAIPEPGDPTADLVAWVIHHPLLASVEGIGVRLESASDDVILASLPRIGSNLLVARSRVASVSDGTGKELADQALELDGRNPEALLLVGEYAWSERSWDRARWAFSSCLQVRTHDVRCLRGLVLTYVEMDKMDEAALVIEGWSGEAPADVSAWLRMAEGLPRPFYSTLPVSGSDGLDEARLWMASRLNTLQYSLPESADSSRHRGELLEALKGLSSPMEQGLVERMTLLQGLRDLDSLPDRDDTRWSSSEDPWVHLALARRSMTAKRTSKLRSREHLDRMARFSSGSARVLYERALLLQDKQPQRAEDVWQRYLELQPSGERLKEVRDRGL